MFRSVYIGEDKKHKKSGLESETRVKEKFVWSKNPG